MCSGLIEEKEHFYLFVGVFVLSVENSDLDILIGVFCTEVDAPRGVSTTLDDIVFGINVYLHVLCCVE